MHRLVEQVSGVHALERRQNVGFLYAGLETHKAADGQRQGGVEVQLLRHVANAQIGLTLQRAGGRFDQSQHHAHQRRLARAVRTQQRENTAGCRLREMFDSTLRLPKATEIFLALSV